MKNTRVESIIDKVVCGDTIDSDALLAVYNQYMQAQHIERVRCLLNLLQEKFPKDRQVRHLNVALSIQQNNFMDAIQQIEALVAECCPQDGLIDAALAVRAKISAETPRTSDTHSPSLSLCMVVKNESAGLGACLHGAKKLVDEIIVVDTGSTDRTKDVAHIYGVKVFDFQWCNDFAAARNYSLEKATGDWVLILDADEIIADKDHGPLKALIKENGHNNFAYNIETRNYTNLANAIGWHANERSHGHYVAGSGWFPTSKVRLFPSKRGIRFRYPVHERVDPDICSLGMNIVDCPIPVHHYGHLNEVKRQEKARLYFQLGYNKLEQFGSDLQAIRELAIQAAQLEKWSKASELWQRFISIKPDYAEAHVNLAGVFWQMGHYEEALASSKSALALDRTFKEAYYNVAISHMFMENLTEATDLLRKLLIEHKDFLAARFMLAAALSFAGEVNQGAEQLRICQATLPKEALALAAKHLIAKLEENSQKAHGEQFKQALDLINVRDT